MHSPIGLALCLKYAHPPNYLELCGPVSRKRDVRAYRVEPSIEYEGQTELLSKFETLYPYLTLIASENGIQDPFDPNVVTAYWIGNALLAKIRPFTVARFLDDSLHVTKKLSKTESESVLTHTAQGGIPFHAFHVLNIWIRTGHDVTKQTVASMDNCMIHAGVVHAISNGSATVKTDRLLHTERRYLLVPSERMIMIPTKHSSVHIGDVVTYHWGTYCDTITNIQHKRLLYWTSYALDQANILGSKHKHTQSVHI
jgi:hypothetical protein